MPTAAENFAHAVGAEVEAQHPVAVLHAAIVADHRRHHELIEFFVGVRIGDDRRCVGKVRAVRFDDGPIGLLDSVPAFVAIHGVIAARHGGDRNGFRQRGEETLDVLARGLRWRVAAVGECVHPRRHAGIGEELGQRRGLILVRMHTARRHQAEQMTGAAAVFEFFDQFHKGRCAIDLAFGDRVVDARQVLHHHASGADIEMPDLGIAHLAVGQADLLAGGAQEAVRAGLPKPVEGRRFGLAHGVVGRVVAPAPAVENDQHHRPPLLHVAFPLVG
jgi:hypothetical protein